MVVTCLLTFDGGMVADDPRRSYRLCSFRWAYWGKFLHAICCHRSKLLHFCSL